MKSWKREIIFNNSFFIIGWKVAKILPKLEIDDCPFCSGVNCEKQLNPEEIDYTYFGQDQYVYIEECSNCGTIAAYHFFDNCPTDYTLIGRSYFYVGFYRAIEIIEQ